MSDVELEEVVKLLGEDEAWRLLLWWVMSAALLIGSSLYVEVHKDPNSLENSRDVQISPLSASP